MDNRSTNVGSILVNVFAYLGQRKSRNHNPDNVKDVFKENRIELPTSFLVEQMEQMVKIKKDMEAAFDYERNSLLPRLEKTINLL